MVLRDSIGDFVASTTVWFEGLCQVHEAKALRIREALSWIKERGIKNFILETNSQVVVSTIQGHSSLLNEFESIIESYLKSLEQNNTSTVVFIRRQFNALAHKLA